MEAAINSRPLTSIPTTPGELGPLTPALFLTGIRGEVPTTVEGIPDISKSSLAYMSKERESALEKFWNLWSTSYLVNLPQVVRNHHEGATLQLGDLVLLREDPPTPRLKWPLAIVTKLHPGRDGKVRAVDIRTSKGRYTRPVQKLHRMELDSPSYPVTEANTDLQDDDEPSLSVNHGHYKTKAGRLSKPPQRWTYTSPNGGEYVAQQGHI